MSSAVVKVVWHVQYDAAAPTSPFNDWRTDSSWITEEAALQAMRKLVDLGGAAFFGGVVPACRVLQEITTHVVVTERAVHPDVLQF